MLRGRSFSLQRPRHRDVVALPRLPRLERVWWTWPWGISPPKALGELGTRAAGEVQSPVAKYNCTTLAEQERMMLAAPRTSL